ncbi:hypothetical protein LTR09_001219 [Extremus antarcticus]|uniref:Uncharacterized protein n=1 Tax=Extremus antarcticus TaxID=702011 RepID=A0AAJ0GIE3_9PEZI|nr:hypothetical protein LTR09_001219 [Extremus antarcticus]
MTSLGLPSSHLDGPIAKKRKLSNPSCPTPQYRKRHHQASATMQAAGESNTAATNTTTSPYFTHTSHDTPSANMASPAVTDDANDNEKKHTLHDLTPQQRQESYRKVFSTKVEPLTHIEGPEVSGAELNFENEIFDAYLRYTTFAVKVWLNYDPTARRFYNHTDQRFASCGIIVLTPSQRKKIVANIAENAEFGRVRFELGTPFTSLADVTVRVVRSTLDVGMQLKVSAKYHVNEHQHGELAGDIEVVERELQEFNIPYGRKGLCLQDLVQLAKVFRRQQTTEEAADYHQQPDDSVWTEVDNDRENNTGYIDKHRGYNEGGSRRAPSEDDGGKGGYGGWVIGGALRV